jgi:hypothetical protein
LGAVEGLVAEHVEVVIEEGKLGAGRIYVGEGGASALTVTLSSYSPPPQVLPKRATHGSSSPQTGRF